MMAPEYSPTEIYDKLWKENEKKDPLAKVKDNPVDSDRDQIAAEISSAYYSSATWIYEFAWGGSFHFARLYHKMGFGACSVLHEMNLFAKLNLPLTEEKWLDVGCGIGGPMRQAIRAGNKKITVFGVNNNKFQINRCKELNSKLGLSERAVLLNCDFSSIKLNDNMIDKAYSIEATCHASDLLIPYKEIYRVLKPGGLFACYEWVVTENYDPNNQKMRKNLVSIQEGCSLIKLHTIEECKNALLKAGFEILEIQDLADSDTFDPKIERPWYASLTFERNIPVYDTLVRVFMRQLNNFLIILLSILERIGLIKPGIAKILEYLNRGGDGLSQSGRMNIYTPMFYFLARKNH